MTEPPRKRRFRIAFSFAGEKREFVAQAAALLANRFAEHDILYDKFHEAEFARHDLGIYLPKLYGEQSDLIVPVLCPNYDVKRWTGWEWLHIYGLLTKADGFRVMPSRFERAMTDGLSPAAGFIELDRKTPEQFVILILQRLALNEGKARDHYCGAVAVDADAPDEFKQQTGWQFCRDKNDILPAQQPTQRIAASRIINRHTSDDFIGRETELGVLDAAWAARDTVNVQCVIAWGGVGKTALLARWVQTRFRDRGWKNDQDQADPIHYFDWTFYDQGTRADDATQAGAASVGTFFVEALRHFGDPEPNLPERKAERLATLVQAHRSLLVLDGLEPLQYPHNHPQAGQITDPDLAQLLRILAQKNPGLCLVSSRVGLSELRGHLASNAPHHELDDLSPEAANALLKLHVTGSDAELAQAAADYQHHALSLILLGRFLATARGGDIRQRDTVSFEKANDKRAAHTRSAWHVLEMYEAWLASPGGNPMDLQALRLIGLFDRPASPDCLEALRREPAITGLTDLLVPLDRDDWNAVLQRLHEAHLIQLKLPLRDPGSQAPYPEPRSVAIDAHPLVREYFAKLLREKQTEGFAAAHSRLFDYLCQSTPYRPDTLEVLQPLYQAVVHGCLAGRSFEACRSIYVDRILRGQDGPTGFFSSKSLGAYSSDLQALTAFFDPPWTTFRGDVNVGHRSFLLNDVANCLSASGRMAEVIAPLEASMTLSRQYLDAASTAVRYNNLSETYLMLGSIDRAIVHGADAVKEADKSSDEFIKSAFRTILAYAFAQGGQWSESKRCFAESTLIQKRRQPEFPNLSSLYGFRFYETEIQPAEQRFWRAFLRIGPKPPSSLMLDKTLRIVERNLSLSQRLGSKLDVALDQCLIAKINLLRNSKSGYLFQASIKSMRSAGTVNFLPLCLIDLAFHYQLTSNSQAAEESLAEAQHIAERGPMPLYLADVHLHRARLVGILPPNQRAEHWPGVDPKDELAKARALIEKHGYWRRREELADAEAAAKNW